MTNTASNILIDTHIEDDKTTDEDKKVLRRLAANVSELADREIEQEKRCLWTKHNDLDKQVRPLIFLRSGKWLGRDNHA